jgi:hypothetical protein
MTGQFRTNAPAARDGVGLALWQAPVPGGAVYTGVMGMNNPNTATMPDAAPALIHRVRAKTVEFMTVLEPHKGPSRIKGVEANAAGGIAVRLQDGQSLAFALDDLIAKYPPPETK